VIEVPFELAGAATGLGSLTNPGSVSLAGTVIATVGSIIAGSVTRPVAAGVTVLLYVDLRMRKEGLDLILQTAARNQYAEGEEFAAAWRPPRPGQL
jgi:hypothetical protein